MLDKTEFLDEEFMASIRSEIKGRREECLLCDEE